MRKTRSLVLVTALVTVFLCTGWGTAALSDHPVVTAITGPNNLNDGWGPTGSYVFMAAVSGGSPPYTYTWMNPPGIKTLYKGKEYSSVTIPAEQLSLSGPGRYGVWLTVTDSAGRDAVWQRDGGVGNSNQFFYGLTYEDYPEPKWSLTTEPKTFPKAAATAPVTTTQNPDCKDSGVRFTSINGQVEVFSECSDRNWKTSIEDPFNWKIAKREMVLYVDDHVRTGDYSETTLGFSDMSTFVMKPEAEIVISTPTGRESKLKLVLGNIWINIKKMAQDGSMEIETNQAVTSIKGTTLVCSADGAASTTQVLEGTVEVKSRADGKSTTLTGGQQVTATASGIASPASFDVAAVNADWDVVKARAAAGSPATTATQKSGLELAFVVAGIGIAAAVVAIRRM